MTSQGTRRARVLFWVAAAAFGVVALAGGVGVWWWWGVGFDEAEALGVAKPSTDTKMVASFWIAMAGLAGLAGSGLLAAALGRRRRS